MIVCVHVNVLQLRVADMSDRWLSFGSDHHYWPKIEKELSKLMLWQKGAILRSQIKSSTLNAQS